MADGTLAAPRAPDCSGQRANSLQRFTRRRSTIAFLMTVPLLTVVLGLIAYPAGYGIYLSLLNRRMTEFAGFLNYEIVFDSDTFWNVAWQSCICAVTAVLAQALIGFWLSIFAVPMVPWLGDGNWARTAIIIVNVWYGAPFFMIMYLAALKSVPEQLYEAAEIDGASSWQRLRYITLPMMANIISITVLFSLIVTFANYDIVRVLTNGGPRDLTHVFASYAFQVGILSGNIPRGAAVSLFMLPVLAICAFFVLRGVTRRNKEQM